MQATHGGATASPGTSTTTDADGSAASSSSSKARDAAGGPVVEAELPLHVTEKILCSISPLESARLATVCKSWAATVSERLAKPVPVLFACMSPHNESHRRGLVVSVPLDGGARSSAPSSSATTDTIPCRVSVYDTVGLRCIGATPSGRVAFACGWWNDSVTLVNPITGALQIIHVGLPHPNPDGLVLASGGTGCDDALFAIDGNALTLRRRQAPGGEEGAWSRCVVEAMSHPEHEHTTNVSSAVSTGDGGRLFYLLHRCGCLSKVDTTSSPPPLRLETKIIGARALYSVNADDGCLVECDGEVLFVRQVLWSCNKQKGEDAAVESAGGTTRFVAATGFEVSRLDVKERRWTKVDKLPDDRALFVSPGSSFAVRASDVEGCRSNCIYFAGRNHHYARSYEDDGSAWGVYSMEHRRVLFEHVVKTEPAGRRANVLWFLPRVV